MLFGVRLKSEVYEPWKNEYIHYDHLKKLLKTGIVGANGQEDTTWTDKDETEFVSYLDKELEKVYSFQVDKYEELSDQIGEIEEEIDRATSGTSADAEMDQEQKQKIDAKKINSKLEDIVESATQLDRFQRLNFTGFVKIVKKHDRLHPKYQVSPLLQVRLSTLPFHSEDYSPLLYRISAVYSFLSENFGTVTQKHTLSSFHGSEDQSFTTLTFWVHKENVMEVKTKILRHLPVLVYNKGGDRAEDERDDIDPKVTSLYFDNSSFNVYSGQLRNLVESRSDSNDKEVGNQISGSSTQSFPPLRLRWHGPLSQQPRICLEAKSDRQFRLFLKEKDINSFISGSPKPIEKAIRKMRGRNASSKEIDNYRQTAESLQSYIKDKSLAPVLRTVYTRTAFEIPGDQNVRVILDSNIRFIREDCFSQESPVRDPDSWHRKDIDQPSLRNPLNVLRKSEYTEFPFAVLQVRVKGNVDLRRLSVSQKGQLGPSIGTPSSSSATRAQPQPWVEDLVQSRLLVPIPRFSKFVQGIASLYAENDHLDALPFWLELEKAEQERFNKNVLQEAQRAAAMRSSSVASTSSSVPENVFAHTELDDDDEGDEGEFSSDDPSSAEDSGPRIGYPTWTRRHRETLDMVSEDEEIILPAGVTKPQVLLKDQGSIKVETKVWLANERTFNRWLHVTAMLSALTFTLYHSLGSSRYSTSAEIAAYSLFFLTIFSALWGYYVYTQRLNYIKRRSEKHLDAPLGPVLIAVGLLIALCVNFWAMFKQRGTF